MRKVGDVDEQQRARVGAQVRQARKAVGLTQLQLAERAGVAGNTVIRVEAGEKVRPGNLRAVLDALGIPPLSQVPERRDEVQDDIDFTCQVIGQVLRGKDERGRRELIRRIMALAASVE